MEANMTVNPLDTRLTQPSESGDLDTSIHFSLSSESEDLSTPMTDASEPSSIPIWDPDTETLPDEEVPDCKTEQKQEIKDVKALGAAIEGFDNSKSQIVNCLRDVLSPSIIALSSKIELCQTSLANCGEDVTMKHYSSLLKTLRTMLEFTKKQLAVPQNKMKESTKNHFAELGITMLQPTENQFAVPQNTMSQLTNNQFSGLENTMMGFTENQFVVPQHTILQPTDNQFVGSENTMTDATFFTQPDYSQTQQNLSWPVNGATAFTQQLEDSTTMGDMVHDTLLQSIEFDGQVFNEQFADATSLFRSMSVSREQQ